MNQGLEAQGYTLGRVWNADAYLRGSQPIHLLTNSGIGQEHLADQPSQGVTNSNRTDPLVFLDEGYQTGTRPQWGVVHRESSFQPCLA